MDELDMKIINVLQLEGRLSLAEVSRRVGAPRTTIAERVEKLVERGVIRGFRAVIDPVKLGYRYLAFVLVKARRGGIVGEKSNQELLAEEIVRDCNDDANLPWVEEVYIITGEYDILLKVWAKEWDHLTNFLIRYMPRHKDVSDTHTILVLKTVHRSPGVKMSTKKEE
ncbi:MAG: Lrp/AsnC family transcriptional regulator [Thermoprotei archaeon]|nr:MAG: Lrp/AsnC family transcriptional regulator [Thermoprotei archaeon]